MGKNRRGLVWAEIMHLQNNLESFSNFLNSSSEEFNKIGNWRLI